MAREAEGRSGGIFMFKRSAVRFAERRSAATGCAIMVLVQRLELDVANHGHAPVMCLDAVLRKVSSLIPDHPSAIRIGRRIFASDHPSLGRRLGDQSG